MVKRRTFKSHGIHVPTLLPLLKNLLFFLRKQYQLGIVAVEPLFGLFYLLTEENREIDIYG